MAASYPPSCWSVRIMPYMWMFLAFGLLAALTTCVAMMGGGT